VEAEKKVGGKSSKGRLLGAIFYPQFFAFVVIRAISIATEEAS
jgi:hypothetical protein